jgi:hypothetical protein
LDRDIVAVLLSVVTVVAPESEADEVVREMYFGSATNDGRRGSSLPEQPSERFSTTHLMVGHALGSCSEQRRPRCMTLPTSNSAEAPPSGSFASASSSSFPSSDSRRTQSSMKIWSSGYARSTASAGL